MNEIGARERTTVGRLLAIVALCLAVAWPSVGWPSVAWAHAPSESASSAPASASADPVSEALATGDLTSARDAAQAARKSDPTPDNWRAEAEVLEQLGDLDGAAAAYQGELDALPKGATARRQSVQTKLDALASEARGTVATEPKSTHRAELDRQWEPSKTKKKRKRKRKLAAAKKPKDRIVKKWYFWVTLTAIVASAAAITGVAIQAARRDRSDSLDALVRQPTRRPTGLGFRF